MSNFNCDLSNPVNYAGQAPTSGEPFAFASSSCMIGNASSEVSEYRLVNTYTYGEIVNSTFAFLTFITLLGIALYCFMTRKEKNV